MKATLFFSILIGFALITSCSNEELNISEKSLLIEKENSLTSQEKIRDLLLVTKGNYEQLACIFNCSPSSLKRLKDGDTFATQEAELEISKHYNYFIVNENSIDNFKADCISYKWYNHVKIFMSNWWFWLGVIIILTIYGFQTRLVEDQGWFSTTRSKENNAGFAFGYFLLVLFVYCVIWVINYFGGEPDFSSIPDNFINNLDTVWESKL